MAIAQAVAFVEAQGDAVALARLAYLLRHEYLGQTAKRAFEGQRADGGWAPFWARDYSSLDATCYRLSQAVPLGLGSDDETIARAVALLSQRQRQDGHWAEDAAVADVAPPWARPGDQAATLYLTANCGFWLAVFALDNPGARRAAGYLLSCLDDQGGLPSYLHTHWLAAGLWYRVGAARAFKLVTDLLARRLPDLTAGNLAWLLTTLRTANVPADLPLVKHARLALTAMQQADGRWVSDDGPDRDVHTTLEALWALQDGA